MATLYDIKPWFQSLLRPKVDELAAQGLPVRADRDAACIEMLRRADLVKFAQVVPKHSAAQQYASVAAQWIQAVEQTRGVQP